jgi:hypothetical protein
MPRSMKLWLGGLLSLTLVAALGYVFRSAIATKVFAFVIDRRAGMDCSHPVLVIARSLKAVEMSSLECRLDEGPLARFETFAPATIALKGFGVEYIHVARAAMDFRGRDVSNIASNTLEDLANVTGMRDQLIKAVLDASAMYSPDAPPVSIDRLEISRERKRESVIHEFAMTQDGEWNRSQGSKVDVGIEGLASLRNFDRRVTPTRGKLTLDLYLGDADPGEKPDTQLRLDGTNLNGPRARFELSLRRKPQSVRVP